MNRFTDAAPILVTRAQTYPSVPTGTVRTATLRDPAGAVMGDVWTDGQAAGFRPAEATPETARAGAHVWAVHARAHRNGVSATGILDPGLYGPYVLDTPDN